MERLTKPLPLRAFIGTAGWSIPRAVADAFAAEGDGLQRYAGRLNAVEINATFYRAPRLATLERWAAETPPRFRFALKAPKAVTHEARLADVATPLAAFIALAGALGDKLGPVLVQLPPSLGLDREAAGAVFAQLSDAELAVACEPRHADWFTPEADAWLAERRVARVAVDPARHPGAGEPGGWRGLTYRRLHGSPRMYYSAYGPEAVEALAKAIEADPAKAAWCVFDNTASGAAAEDALMLSERLA